MTLDADAGEDVTAEVGEEVVLDGGNSTASVETFSFEWSFVSTPENSTAELQNANTETPSFTPDVEGEYMVKLTISTDDKEDTDNVIVDAYRVGPDEISEDIESNTIWENHIDDPDVPDYHVTDDIDVNADLTIEPGVKVHFDQDVFMTVENGAIVAEGNSGEWITLTSSSEEGEVNWGGVIISSSDSRNTISYTEIRYAGGDEIGFADFTDKKAAVGLKEDGELNLNNSVISNSDGYGLYVRYGELSEFENNEFNDNEEQGIGVCMTKAAVIDENTTFSGNEYAVDIFGSESAEGDELTYINLSGDASYYVTGDLENNAELTIDPGAKFEFRQNVGMTVTPDGMLKADAEGDETVIFTGASDHAHWKGIGVESSDARNELNNVEISGAGSYEWGFEDFKDKEAALALKTGGEIKLKNSVISNSNGYGMYARYGEVTEFEGNTFTDNNGPAIGLYADLAGMIDEETSFSGNEWDGVEIFESTLNEDATWINLQGGAKYGVTGDLTVQAALDIDPGAAFEFDIDKELKIHSDGGSLNAVGTANSKITFTCAVEGSRWSGIHFRSSSMLNQLEHVEVHYAGSVEVRLDEFEDKKAAVSGDKNGLLEMTNSQITYSGGYGVYWQDETTINDDVGDENEFENNEKEDVVIVY